VRIARIALDVPLDEAFDFRMPAGLEAPVGSLVVVPFGRSRKVGVVLEHAPASDVPAERLRDIESVVEDVPPFEDADLELFRFCARYYQRPLGEVIATGLPPRLRQVKRRRIALQPVPECAGRFVPAHAPTEAQKEAIAEVLSGRERFHPVLLEGVTGSGKTEVYLHLIADTLARGRQALLLVPEIGLTPQFEEHVRARFPGTSMLTAHSHLSEGERAHAWLAARTAAAQVILGTRLAVLSPFRDLGLIVVDEEHDLSYKQHEGMRYSARDVAVVRARNLGIPIVLGSATPSLESFWNAREGRYAHVRLAARAAAGAAMPTVRMVDTRADRPEDGLSHALAQALRQRLERGEQSLVFLNRRGYAPVLFCRDCQWHSSCTRCSANLVLHRGENRLRCHHCGHVERPPQRCPSCGGADIAPVGHGTQRVEEKLQERFPQARIARVDRDSTARKNALREVLGRVRAGEVDILVGTQMLAKGHDYPRLTLVGVLESDSALFSADFRAAERLFAQLSQVAGRAGRAERPGEVLIQTDFPGHPLYAAVASHDYGRFAAAALDERHVAHFPPYASLALLRAESQKPGEALAFLARAARAAHAPDGHVEVFDPVPARLERKAGFERAQLLVRADTRGAMQAFLAPWRQALAQLAPRRVRWALDVDPQEV
jgi:primosomal protein N' (replication factor Y)